MYPNFFIVGAAKAGTTSLYKYLDCHPDIYMSPIKEPHFFSRVDPDKNPLNKVVSDRDEYLRLFDGVTGEKMVGEASPSYLWDKDTPARIKDVVPDAKIIILLRSPIDRVYSHYLMDVHDECQNQPFLEALKDDEVSGPKEWGGAHLYIELGLYANQVSRYFQCFGEKNVLILFFEEFINDTKSTVERVLSFLEVDVAVVDDIPVKVKHNQYSSSPSNFIERYRSSRLMTLGGNIFPTQLKSYVRETFFQNSVRKKEKPKIDTQSYDFLLDKYKQDGIKLAEVLHSDLPWKL